MAIYLLGLIIIDSQAIVRHGEFTTPRLSLESYETIVLHLVYGAKCLSKKIIKHQKKHNKNVRLIKENKATVASN